MSLNQHHRHWPLLEHPDLKKSLQIWISGEEISYCRLCACLRNLFSKVIASLIHIVISNPFLLQAWLLIIISKFFLQLGIIQPYLSYSQIFKQSHNSFHGSKKYSSKFLENFIFEDTSLQGSSWKTNSIVAWKLENSTKIAWGEV